MHKTEKSILKDVFIKLREGGIEDIISGKLYIKYRPANSKLEDCVIRMIAGQDSDFQRGAITVNVHVPNIAVYGNNGFLAENEIRTNIISDKLNEIVHDCKFMCSGPYWFEPNVIVSTFPYEEQDAHFHVVNAQFNFTRFSYDSTLKN